MAGKRLTGKRALITGGSSGIGAAIVSAYAAEGAAVAIGASRHAEQARTLAESVNGGGGKAVVVVGDLTSRAETDKIVDDAIAELGGLDIFVHCAGIDVTQTAPTHETPDDMWDRMLAIHLTSAFRIAKRAIPAMLQANNKPSVIFVGSVAGIMAWEGDVAYNVAKAGLHHLAKSIAADYAKQGLRANVIAPGVIDTPLTRAFAEGMPGTMDDAMQTLANMHPMGRYATVDEVAGSAVFLASDKSSFVTGVVLPVDGGLTMV